MQQWQILHRKKDIAEKWDLGLRIRDSNGGTRDPGPRTLIIGETRDLRPETLKVGPRSESLSIRGTRGPRHVHFQKICIVFSETWRL